MSSVMLYFGSFNPVHKGHLAVAEWVLERNLCDELWFVVSPRNPLKEESSLIGEQHRLAMVFLAIESSRYAARMKACDVEFRLSRPSYTVDTLSVLGLLYPQTAFSILVGSDIPTQIENWKEGSKITDNYKIYVYPRRGYSTVRLDRRFEILADAPYKDYSSTEAREEIAGLGTFGMLPEKVKEYIKRHELWITKEI